MLKHRSDYQTPSCNVLAADLDIRIFEDRTLVTTVLKLCLLYTSPSPRDRG